MVLTLRSRSRSKTIGNVGRAAKVDAQCWCSLARGYYVRHIEKVLSELVVGVCNVLAAQGYAGERIKAIKDKIGRRVGTVDEFSNESDNLEGHAYSRPTSGSLMYVQFDQLALH